MQDQLSRAILSIPLNIAEGNGRWHKKEKKQFFWIARGSAFEVIPIIQAIHMKGLVSEMDYQDFYNRLTRVAQMLTKLIKSVDHLNNNF